MGGGGKGGLSLSNCCEEKAVKGQCIFTVNAMQVVIASGELYSRSFFEKEIRTDDIQ